ncbi:MAG: LysR family transcriptional regulator [Hamadaea sp.]|nr:LysR family transcriptional regulator [Hamadaea sp.]
MRLELHHLRVLRAIDEHGSLSRAAAALGVSQPALSTQLRRIERCLDGPVFERDVRGVTPTAYGEFVLARVRGALSNVEDLVTGEPAGARLRLGVIEGPLVVGLLGVLEEEVPGRVVTVHAEYSTLLLLDLVASGKLDIALLADYPGYELDRRPDLVVHPLVTEPGFVALSTAHPLADHDDIDLAALAGEPWIVPPSDGTGWPEHMLDACRAAGFTPSVRHTVVDNRLQRMLIDGGRAVAIVQATTRPTATMAVRPLTGDPLWMRYLLAWRRRGPLHDAGERLVARAREVYAAADTSVYAGWRARRS